MAGRVTLKVTKGTVWRTGPAGEDFRAQEFVFDEHDTFIFGRDSDCHARIDKADGTASRHHFVLEVNPPDACVRDLASLNGTWVNDSKHGGRDGNKSPDEARAAGTYQNVDVRSGDRISVGNTTFSISISPPAYCARCRESIREADKTAAAHPEGFVCGPCRAKPVPLLESGVPAAPVAPPVPQKLTCKKCGKDVAKEVSGGRQGDYVCKACQENVADNPLAALLDAIMNDRRGLPEPAVGDIPGHTVGKLLARGGMGAVYKAKRNADGAEVALKVMLAKVAVDQHSRKTFLRESFLASQLQHPNVVRLYDRGGAGTAFYFTMEFCEGGSVFDLMQRRGGRLGLAESAPIMLQALEGLAYAHTAPVDVELADGTMKRSSGVVHRDLKPHNILLAGPESRRVAKLSDYGLAKCFNTSGLSGHTVTAGPAGTVAFMPREQVIQFKDVKPPADVWAMGASFYNMLTGTYPRDFPFGQDPLAIILRAPIVPIRERDGNIPKNVAAVIDKSTENDWKKRYATALEFKSALQSALVADRV